MWPLWQFLLYPIPMTWFPNSCLPPSQIICLTSLSWRFWVVTSSSCGNSRRVLEFLCLQLSIFSGVLVTMLGLAGFSIINRTTRRWSDGRRRQRSLWTRPPGRIHIPTGTGYSNMNWKLRLGPTILSTKPQLSTTLGSSLGALST